MRAAALGAAIAFVAAGCPRDVRVRLPAEPDEPTGSITVVVTQPTRDLTVSVNGVLVAERRHTEKVRVDGVPAGMADVVIAAGAGEARLERHVRVAVDEGADTAIPVGAPRESTLRTVALGFLSVAAWVLGRAAYLALL